MRLDSVRVLDLTRLLPGPYATQLLADAGADVIKIEDTETGDYARYMPPRDGMDGIFATVNRGKRSVALDLKTDGGRDAFYRLVSDADVVVESFRPGVTERLGIDHGTVRERNPSIVYCSLTGYGQTGSRAEHAGHDLNYIGRAGLLDMTRKNDDARPQIPGYPIADMAGGLFTAFSIVSALCSRELGKTVASACGCEKRRFSRSRKRVAFSRTPALRLAGSRSRCSRELGDNGTGEYIDIAMTDVVLSFSQALAPDAWVGENPRPGETPLTGGVPWYDVYETADGRYVTLAALEPKFWRNFCESVGREDLISKHMNSDPAVQRVLREKLESIFEERTREEWIEFLGNDTTVDGVYTPEEALNAAQFYDRGVIRETEDGSPRVGFPAVLDLPEGDGSIPEHGEQTNEVLRAAGYEKSTLEQLREQDAIL